MNVQNNISPKGKNRTMKKGERSSQEDTLRQLLDDHKNSLGEVIQIKIDNRTYIEIPANLSEEDRKDRVKNYLKNTNYKPSN